MEVCGSALEAIERDLHIGLHQYVQDGQIYWTLPNAGRIWLTGCSDRLECEKFRGDARSEVVIDEADSMRAYLEYLALDCIEPSLLDLQGTLVLSGTPGPTLAGYFHRATTDPALGWSLHHWTALENPHLPNAAAWIERKKLEMSRPRYCREILGIWERDAESLIFDYQDDKNYIDGSKLPSSTTPGWRTVLGVDIGYNDPCAWTIYRYEQGRPELFITKSWKQSGLTPSQAGARTHRIMQDHGIRRVIIDSGGIGKGYSSEWAERYGIHCEIAQKRGRRERLATFSGEVRTGQIKIDPVEAKDLLDEWAILQWSDEQEASDGPDHCTDSAMYAWSSIRPSGPHYDPEFEMTDADKAALAARKLKEDAIRRVQQRNKRH